MNKARLASTFHTRGQTELLDMLYAMQMEASCNKQAFG